jgi:putative FmdB family regulatory protein
LPIYEYACAACGGSFEVLQKFSDDPIETCQLCGEGPVRKVLHPVAIHFKGSGFYTTDYAKKSSSHPSVDKSQDKGSDGEGVAENVKMNPDGETATLKMSEKMKAENRKARAEKRAAAKKE